MPSHLRMRHKFSWQELSSLMIAQRTRPKPELLGRRFASFDPRHEASSLSVAHVNVPDAGDGEAPRNGSLNLAMTWPFAGQDHAIIAIRFQGKRQLAQLLREFVDRREHFACV